MPEGVDRVKVLWVAKGLGPGGMEQLLVNHASVGDRTRLEYHAAYLVERPNTVAPILEANGVRCHRLGSADPRDPRWVVQLAALVRRERFDVVHLHSPFMASLARPALRGLPDRPRVVYTEHNSAECYAAPTRWANLATYPLDDARFAVSSAARDSTPRRLRSRTEVLIHGVDVERLSKMVTGRDAARAELGLREGEQLVGIVANLRPAKAYPVLMRAAKLVTDAEPGVNFVSLGQGPLEDELRSLHTDLALGRRFRFLGFTPNAPEVMAAFDVMTLSSDIEGLPVSVMEGKALGLPMVTTAVGGLPEMISDGVDGLLVPPGDPELLARSLLRVLRDDDLRGRLADASGASAKRFDAVVAVRRQDELYLELAAPS